MWQDAAQRKQRREEKKPPAAQGPVAPENPFLQRKAVLRIRFPLQGGDYDDSVI